MPVCVCACVHTLIHPQRYAHTCRVHAPTQPTDIVPFSPSSTHMQHMYTCPHYLTLPTLTASPPQHPCTSSHPPTPTPHPPTPHTPTPTTTPRPHHQNRPERVHAHTRTRSRFQRIHVCRHERRRVRHEGILAPPSPSPSSTAHTHGYPSVRTHPGTTCCHGSARRRRHQPVLL